MGITRREFISTTGKAVTGVGAAAAIPSFVKSMKSRPPSDKVVVGVIGCRGMGWSNLVQFLNLDNVECSALCDVDREVLNGRAGDLESRTGTRATLHTDYREMLEDPDIDAVIIGTPDHWHCLQTVHACQAGKDVYVEKPLGRVTDECDVMVEAAEKHERVVQVGQWQRSGRHWNDAIRYVQSGELGNVRVVKSWAYQGWMGSIPVLPDEPAPEGVDYDMWLGPAPDRPFNPNRFHFNFRWFWDYAGGLMTDWGVHLIDIVLAAMGGEAPLSVMASGGKYGFPDDAMETPDTLQAIYEFPGYNMIWEQAAGIDNGPYGRNHGVAFIGNNGTLVVDRSGWEVLSETEDGDGGRRNIIGDVETTQSDGNDLRVHVQNFVDCMKSRDTPNCDIATGANTAIICNLGNIAYLSGEKIHWDHAARRITNIAEANDLLVSTYSSPWQFPDP